MKKPAIIFAVLMLFTILPAAAQSAFSMGCYLQPQLTSISGDIVTTIPEYRLERKQTAGFGFGLQFTFHFTDAFSLNSGVLFSTQGQDYEDLTFHTEPQSNNTVKYSTSLDYMKIPVLVEYLFNADHKVSYQVYGGMYLGFLSSYEINTQKEIVNDNGDLTYGLDMSAANKNVSAYVNTGTNTNYVHYTLTEEPYMTFDYGAQFGAGIVFNCSDKFSIPVSVNYEMSFANLKNPDSSWSSPNGDQSQSYWSFFGAKTADKMTNSVIGLRVGIRMRIGDNPNFD
jgi:hypothetical protein